MSATSFFRGHLIVWMHDMWVYADNWRRSGFDGEIRPCKKCGLLFEGSNIGKADPCLGELPGIDNACCGHGIKKHSYIRFITGVVVKNFDIEYTEVWRKNNGNN